MIYGYARVSTKGQEKDGNSLEAQIAALKAAGAEEIYSDAFTGTKTDRPQLNELLSKIGSGDRLVVAKLDRVARSADQGYKLVEDLMKKGVTIHILNMGLMDDSSTGRLIRHIMFAFAEFERDMIITRTQEGKAIARKRPGFHEGRPKKYDSEKIAYALDMLQDHSYTQVTKITGISKSTLIRVKRRLGAEE